jgi:hypothetical protein
MESQEFGPWVQNTGFNSTWDGGELGLWVPAEGVDGEGETDDAEASLQPSPTMSHLLFCLSVQPVAPIPP